MRRYLCFALALGLTACGGGGGGTGSVLTPNLPVATPTPTPTPVPVQNNAPTFSIVVPARTSSVKRAPSFVSSASLSIVVRRNSPSGPVTGSAQSISAASCTVSTPCTVHGPAWVSGQVNSYTLTTYDNAVPASGHALDTATITFTPTASQTTQAVTLLGIPAGVNLTGLPPSQLHANTSGTYALTVSVNDASFQTITGPYAYPVQITDSDSNAYGTSVTGTNPGSNCTDSHTGLTVPTCAILNSPSDSASFVYGGVAENVASTLNVNSSAAKIGGYSVGTPILNAIVWNNGPTSLLGGKGIDLNTSDSSSPTGYSGSEQYTELGFTNSPFNKSLSVTGASACSTFATLGTGTNDTTNGTPFTATAIASPASGTCTLTVTDGLGNASAPTFVVTYTKSGVIVSSRPGRKQ